MASAARIFISYAHEDDALRKRLRAHLSALERDGLVAAWDDREIPAGSEWADHIDDRLEKADVILLLISADFIRSDYCYRKELARALERHKAEDDGAIVIPVSLRRCDWGNAPFAGLQALPADARPLTDWPSEDDYFEAVAGGLRVRLGKAQRAAPTAAPPIDRPVERRRLRRWLAAGLVLAAAVGGGGAAWWSASRKAAREVEAGIEALRAGRYREAEATLEPPCRRWLVGGGACFALEKARLATVLEEGPEGTELERFAGRVERLRERSPDDPDLLLFAGQLALMERDPDTRAQRIRDGLDLVRRAVEREPEFPEAYFTLASWQLLGGNEEDAVVLLNRALSTAPKAAHYLNARAYARALTGDLEGARADYLQSAEDGALVLSRVELAELLWFLGELEAARDQLQAAVAELGTEDRVLDGRNALPWTIESEPRRHLVLKQDHEKRCYARLMLAASRCLLGEPTGIETDGCGAHASGIVSAVALKLGSGPAPTAGRADSCAAELSAASALP